MKKMFFILLLFAISANIHGVLRLNSKQPSVIPPRTNLDAKIPGVRNYLNVPSYQRAYGCNPTALAMIVAYYRNETNLFPNAWNSTLPMTNYGFIGGSSTENPLIASKAGLENCNNQNNYYVEYHWVAEDSSDPDPYINAMWAFPRPIDCLAEACETGFSTRDLNDGSTMPTLGDNIFASSTTLADLINSSTGNIPGIRGWSGLYKYMEAKGCGSSINTQTSKAYYTSVSDYHSIEYTYTNLKYDIDHGNPVYAELFDNTGTNGHAVVIIGYNDSPGSQQIFINDGWGTGTTMMDWTGSLPYGNINLKIETVAVIKLNNGNGNVGTEDYILCSILNNIYAPNQAISFNANFYDSSPEGDFVNNWSWKLSLSHTNGDYIVNQGYSNSINSFNATSSFPLSIPLNYSWMRNNNGNIEAKLTIIGTDNAGITHEVIKNFTVSYAPTKPIISDYYQYNNKLFFFFNNNGGTSMQVYYDTNSGFPYSGTGAVNGASPFILSGKNYVVIDGLQTNANYYLRFCAINSGGTSVFSDEVVIKLATTNGILSTNETWNNKIYTTGSIVVPSGNSLTISPNTKIELLDHAKLTINTGGALIIGNNAMLKGSKPTVIHDESSPVWTDFGNKIDVFGNITLGTNIKFTASEEKYWDGLFLYNNATKSLNSVEFKNCNLNNENGTLNISNITFNSSILTNKNANLTMLNSTIFDGTIYCLNYGTPYLSTSITNSSVSGNGDGIYISGHMNYQITECNISNNSGTGINIYNTSGSPALIKNCTIFNNSNTGIRFYESQGTVQSCNVSENQRGIMAYRGSIIEIKKDPISQPWTDDNIIANNDYEELYFLNDCTMTLDGNRNKIMDNDSYYLVNCPNSTYNRVFRSNYWGYSNSAGAILPPANRFNPSVINPIPNQIGYLLSNVWNPGSPRSSNSMQAQLLYEEGMTAKENNNTQIAESKFKQLISEYPESEYIQGSARQLIEVCDNKDELKGYFKNETNLHSNEIITRYAEYLYNYCDLQLGNYEEAITFFENIINNPPTEIDSILAIIDAGYTYLLMDENGSKSSNFLGKISKLKPKSKIQFELDKNELLTKLTGEPISQQESNYQSSPILNIPILNGNYPNPFNPTTTISFILPNDTQVELLVYNIKGQKIKTLVNHQLKTGQHNIIWDGKDENGKQVATGIYFNQLKTPATIITKKMLMIK